MADADWEKLMQIYHSGDWGDSYNYKNSEIQIIKVKCECGQSSVQSHEGDNWEHHSLWCPVYIQGKNNED